jgi:hypothetical protein
VPCSGFTDQVNYDREAREMRLRLISSAIMVCALAALSGAEAGAASKRVYKGKTVQKHRIRAAVSGNKLKVLHFKARLRCRDGSVLVVDESGFLPTPIRGNGKFHDVQVGSTDRVLLKGKIRGRVVRGKIRVIDKLRSGVKCNSSLVKFTAKRR